MASDENHDEDKPDEDRRELLKKIGLVGAGAGAAMAFSQMPAEAEAAAPYSLDNSGIGSPSNHVPPIYTVNLVADATSLTHDEIQVVLAQGSITATGGSSPAFNSTLGLVLSETKYFVVVLAPEDPGWNADYGFNHDWGRQWDDSMSAMDIYLTVNWDVDPGAGNDLTIDYKVIER